MSDFSSNIYPFTPTAQANNNSAASADYIGFLSFFAATGATDLSGNVAINNPLEPGTVGSDGTENDAADFYSFSYLDDGLDSAWISLDSFFSSADPSIDTAMITVTPISGFAPSAQPFTIGFDDLDWREWGLDGSGTAVFEITGQALDEFDQPLFAPYNVYVSTTDPELAMMGVTVIGTDMRTVINGTSSAEFISGTAGDDDIQTFAGSDTVNAGDGNDEVQGQGGFDTLRGQDGDDLLFGASGGDDLFGGNGHDLLSGGAGLDFLSGATGNDNLIGGFASDVLFGGSGDDRLSGGNGSDTLIGDDGQDYLIGGFASDELIGGSGDDRMSGGSGNDFFEEQSTNDGNDLIDGGFGVDQVFYDANQADATIVDLGTHVEVTVGGFIDELVSIEQINFNDGTVFI